MLTSPPDPQAWTIVSIKDGSSVDIAHLSVKGSFPKKDFGFHHSFELTKYLSQIEIPYSNWAHGKISNHLVQKPWPGHSCVVIAMKL